MKIRGLMVAALLFIVLAGILYWSEHRKPADETTTASANAAPAILKLDPSSITGLELQRKDATPIALTKAQSGQWQITAPEAFGADESTVSNLLTTLSSLNSERLVEDKTADLKQYGLESPALQVDIKEKGNKEQQLLLGDDTPAGGAVYAKLASDPRIFTIAGYEKTSVDKSLNDLRDKRLLTVNPDKISRIELVTKNQDIEFSRKQSGPGQEEWEIVKPKPMRANDSQVSELDRTLTGARMDLSAASDSDKDAAAAFARAAPVATVKVTDDAGTQELQVRNSQAGKNGGANGETYYAKSSAVGGIYKVDAGLGQAVDKGLDDFRDKKLFDFGFAEPNKIEVHIASKGYFLVRSGDDWWQDGKKMDAASVESLVSNLRDLTADKFVDSGFISPVIELTVTSSDGKRVEKAGIAKSGEHYVARRDNDPTLYRLSSSTVDDLQKAVEAIKPAALAKK